jgi:four helix bundle protein
MSGSFKKLEAWKKSIELGKRIYQLTKNFPEEEMYGIISQIRKATVSISSNIAEGAGAGTDKLFIKHLRIAVGSSNEVESLSIILNQLDYIKDKDFDNIEQSLEDIRKLSYGLINYLQEKNRGA